ncbi:MAG: regulatory protein RecX [Armatimonadota bacterium]
MSPDRDLPKPAARARNRELQYGLHVVSIGVSQRDPSSCRVTIQGVGTLSLDTKTVDALGLAENTPVDPTLLERTKDAAARHEARAIAIRLLERRLRSRAELQVALRRRGVPADAAVAVIGDLKRGGWVDDTQFARAWVRDRLALLPCGPRRLRSELMAKGVAVQVADEVITALLPPAREDELALARAR